MAKYTLWVMPPDPVKSILQKIILDLSKKYKTPSFEPHMTLLGDIEVSEEEIMAGTKKLALMLKPFNLALGEVSFSTTYFQSVFVRVKSSAKLMQANLLAKQIFNIENTLFMPHISLLYGNHDMEAREKIAAEIKLPVDLSFQADKIIIIPTTENPKDWHHLAEVSL